MISIKLNIDNIKLNPLKPVAKLTLRNYSITPNSNWQIEIVINRTVIVYLF